MYILMDCLRDNALSNSEVIHNLDNLKEESHPGKLFVLHLRYVISRVRS